MNRKDFFKSSLAFGACSGCFLLPATSLMAADTVPEDDENLGNSLAKVNSEFDPYIELWLADDHRMRSELYLTVAFPLSIFVYALSVYFFSYL
jgi:hypothetical protein